MSAVADLGYDDKLALVEWSKAHEGDGGFIPRALRRMPLETRLAFAKSGDLTAAWRQRERVRCASSFVYFMRSYGSIEPPKGDPIPFDPWPEQVDAARRLVASLWLVFLKSRRLGISWLVLHYVYWLCAFSPDGGSARVLILSKGLDDARKLLDRVRRIDERLPHFLRPERPRSGADNASTFGIRRAEITCLPATEGAARQETASVVVLEEFAHVRDQRAPGISTAVQPTAEGGGQIVVVFTGNGTTGDGAEAARLYLETANGTIDGDAIFLPWHVRPDRTPAWREKERKKYESDEAFFAEYPETVEQALAGSRSIKVYPPEGVAAALKLGEQLWRPGLNEFDALFEQGVEIGTDWGDFQTFTLYAVALPGAGLYFIDELVQPHVEPALASKTILEHEPPGPGAAKVRSNADAAPAGTNKTFVSVLVAKQAAGENVPAAHMRVPFGTYKEGGGERKGGVNTVGFLKWLMRGSCEHLEAGRSIDDIHGALAIHPRCALFAKQMQNLERDPETGRVRKPSLDPKHPERGDHGCDAAIALAATPRAKTWQASKEASEA